MQRGAIFRRDQIAKGLEELRRLYRWQGYVNFVAVPNTEFDNAYETVDMQIDVQEGKQFRPRRVEVIGLAPETKARVLNDY